MSTKILLTGIIAVAVLLIARVSVVADSASAIYSTITSEIVLEIKTTEDGLEVIDCQVEIKDFE